MDILLSSWRLGTKKTYHTYLKAWVAYATRKDIPIACPSTAQALAFLSELSRTGCSYNQLNTARSVLSLIIGQSSDEISWGERPLVKRFMKGHFEDKPILPRFYYTWDVSVVFNYFRGLPGPAHLSLRFLTKKLCLLLVLLSGGQRSQTIHQVEATDVRVVGQRLLIPIMGKIKQTAPGRHMAPLQFPVYTRDEKLCVVTHLTWYLARTRAVRRDRKLFLSYIKPHRAVTKDTVARWCKSVQTDAGIDTSAFTSHSSRSAATSSAKRKGISLRKIADSAGWSSERTFAGFYDKEVLDDTTFQDLMIS